MKDGAPVRTGQSGQVGDPSDTDQMSEGGPSLHHHHHGGGGNTKQPIFAVDNVEQLPVFINHIGGLADNGGILENGAGGIIVPQHLH